MRFCISLTTAAAFWLHVLLGCCAHHGHATADSDCAHAVAHFGGHHHDDARDEDADSHRGSERGEDAHWHGDESSHGDELASGEPSCADSGESNSPGHHQHRGCHEGHCSVIVKVESTAIAKALIAEFAGQLTDAGHIAISPANFDRYPIDFSDGHALPIALYLAQQTLLI